MALESLEKGIYTSKTDVVCLKDKYNFASVVPSPSLPPCMTFMSCRKVGRKEGSYWDVTSPNSNSVQLIIIVHVHPTIISYNLFNIKNKKYFSIRTDCEHI